VRTTESFPLFYPFEADFANLCSFLGSAAPAATCPNGPANPAPFVIFFEKFQAPNFNEKTINPAVYQGGAISSAIRNQAKGVMDHTYNGLFIQDKARVTNRLTVNFGVRYEWETWPSAAVNTDSNNIDPRAGFAYNVGTKWNLVVRGGFGIYHGTIPSPLLSCQIPSCGGRLPYPGRENVEDTLNATTGLFAFASAPFITNLAILNLLGRPNLLNPAPTTGAYPDGVNSSFLGCPGQPAEDPPIPPGTLAGCGFFGDAVIVRFVKDHQAPLSYQTGLGLEFQPGRNFTVTTSLLHVRGERLGSFFNVNQPDPTGQVMVHNSGGAAGPKNTYFCPVAICGPGIPGVRNPRFAVYFEAASRWDSVYDGLLLTADRRAGKYVNFGLSYTFSKGLDNGPNPSFVLIPQDSKNFRAEKAFSADYAKSRFTGNTVFTSPHDWNVFLRDSLAAFIVTLESPHYFTKFAGFDANGDVFGNNDRVGIEARNTFRGDSLQSVDVRLARTLPIREKIKMEMIAEAFNLFNTVNVRFFNTVYGAADFCPFNATAPGCNGVTKFFKEGSPNPAYGTPRAVYNPRQLQFAVRFTF
jgi:hypothetical protein